MFEVEPLSFDGVSHVVENLRPDDRREVVAGRAGEDNWEDELTAYIGREATFGFVARKDGEPAAVFGAVPLRKDLWQVHRYATPRWPEVSFSVGKVVKSQFLPLLRHVGAERVQCALLASNTDAHAWTEWCGFDRGDELPGAGRDGEDFVEFAKMWRH